MMKTIAIIPARAGSKRIKDKNIREFAGKPLLFWSIDSAVASNKIDEVWVSTECEHIQDMVRVNYCEDLRGASALSRAIARDKLAFRYGKPISIIHRPTELAQDDSSVIDVVRHAIDHFSYENCLIVLLYPTYPLRTVGLVNDVIDFAKMQGYGNTITVVKGDKKVYWYVDLTCGNLIQKILPNEIYREQDMQQPYRLAGAVHCIFSDDLKEMDKNGMSKHNFGYVIEAEGQPVACDRTRQCAGTADQSLCLEVDDEEAFCKAEQIMQCRIFSTISSGYEKYHFNYN